jgi:phosphoribosylformylglycinamidine synthase
MIHFFGSLKSKIFAVQTKVPLKPSDIPKLEWLFGDVPAINDSSIPASFIGPRAAMVTPWSTNAVEITQNMGISVLVRIECFEPAAKIPSFDPMLFQNYAVLNQSIFDIDKKPEPIREITDIRAYNEKEGLALNSEEVTYLEGLSHQLERPLTDAEVFGFSQVNSEHCRHKIFNGTFVIDGQEMPESLFQLIKKTSKVNPNQIVSAYRDNVAFIKGPALTQFAPKTSYQADWYQESTFESIISLKAETHNFPTTVEPFNGAATGSGGEIRDRLAGGIGSLPLAGTAVYMTPYSRSSNRAWEQNIPARPWRYQTPMDILIKASNGASDFGNKFGQPLIAGSLLTFEHEEDQSTLGFDKVIMLAGGVGYGKADYAHKKEPQAGDVIVVLGGDNYRIGMGGAAVSSTDTGAYASGIELNAVQRSNPEMQKRVADTIRALVESTDNPVISIHDHGAGGHLNCLSELVENSGGKINIDLLPVGDPTLSFKEIIGNESQERMGLIIPKSFVPRLKEIADRERAPMFVVGEVTGDHRFEFVSESTGEKPMSLALEDMFGSSPKTIMSDQTIEATFEPIIYKQEDFQSHLKSVLNLEAVACKDWLTNKVDRCVGGRVATQQCTGPLQLPLNNCGVMALDFTSNQGVATSIGHAPVSGLIDPIAGSLNSIGEALSNIIWAPLEHGLSGISLSANWMWPCNNPGEDARLYRAVQAVSDFSIALGINVPTGKDSLSMKQKYKDRDVIAPGTVIISATGHCSDIRKTVSPVLQKNAGAIFYLNLSRCDFKLGGSAFGQSLNKIGNEAPTINDASFFKLKFDQVQSLIKGGHLAAGHDVGSGGLITTLLEMCFADVQLGANFDLTELNESDSTQLLFAENISLVFQAKTVASEEAIKKLIPEAVQIGHTTSSDTLSILNHKDQLTLSVSELRDVWFQSSYEMDKVQTANGLAKVRLDHYKTQPLSYLFPKEFDGSLPKKPQGRRPRAGILREKGSNSDREMAHALYLAGFEVKDIHMTDLISGRENLEDLSFLGAVGGFSNSDVLGSAKGWAGAFKYNDKARESLAKFFNRHDTLSIGICNGCQLFMELNLINSDLEQPGKMTHNQSQKHESIFTSVKIEANDSIMLGSLAGSTLGIWVSHGEGKFDLPLPESRYRVVAKYGYDSYPSNPNGSDYNTAMLCDLTGRHLVTMPHIERSIFQWNWAYYPDRSDAVSPWLEAFFNARNWVLKHS